MMDYYSEHRVLVGFVKLSPQMRRILHRGGVLSDPEVIIIIKKKILKKFFFYTTQGQGIVWGSTNEVVEIFRERIERIAADTTYEETKAALDLSGLTSVRKNFFF